MPNLTYNGYPFEDRAVWFTIVKQPIISGTNRRIYVDNHWYCDGRVSGNSQADVTAKMQAVENAMVDGGDLVFSIYHTLRSADCVAGTKVRNFRWLPGYDGVRGSGAEMVLRRTFKFEIYGRVLATSDTDIIMYRESVRGYGDGGPIILPVGSLTGDVQPQIPQLKTEWHGIQSGFAIGLVATPAAATPIWQATAGVYYDHPNINVELDTPINWGINQNTGFKIAWNYKCWSRSVLATSPPAPF